ncbi:glycosyltransferase family 2 protein [Candidatus Woesebacteria bacterium]|nr:glycosyltransferase family 2 protein [Candidatus Woesebacteria bacterium]
MPELSIIIISYNTQDITKRCLETIVASLKTDTSLKAEIIVLDNNSSDGSVEMLKSFAGIECIFSKENLGFGKGNNEAVMHAKGEYLLFLNSDTEALDDAVPQLLSEFKQAQFDFAGARLLNKDRSVQLSVGRFYTLWIAFLALFLFADRWHGTRYSPTSTRKVDWVSGACFITRTKTYQQLSGFDPAIFMYWEEVDLFYRAAKQHMSVGFLPQPTFIHLEGASSKSRTAPIIKVFEGYLIFYKKHYSPLHVGVLRCMLQLKALSSLLVGKLIGSTYLIETYSKAYEVSKNTR